MDKNRVDYFIMSMGDKFLSRDHMAIRTELEKMDHQQFSYITSLDYKNPVVLLLFSLFLGPLGVDRFLLGQTGWGLLKLLTFGGLGIWAFIDFFQIMRLTKDYNYRLFINSLGY